VNFNMTSIPYGNILEAIDRLSLEDQQSLIETLHRRLTEQGRKALAVDIAKARQEFAEGQCRPATAEELMQELLL